MRIGCSQQGGVDAVLLREARPDIGASWYPPPPHAARAFDNAPLPPAVQAVTRAALAAAPVWQPRFKTLHFSQESTMPGKHLSTLCVVSDTFRASAISASLPGDATRFACTWQKNGYVLESALLHDLGIAVQLRTVSKEHGESRCRYLDVKVTR